MSESEKQLSPGAAAFQNCWRKKKKEEKKKVEGGGGGRGLNPNAGSIVSCSRMHETPIDLLYVSRQPVGRQPVLGTALRFMTCVPATTAAGRDTDESKRRCGKK